VTATSSRVVIDNPVLNSPYQEPQRHFLFTEDGITNQVIEGRRLSAYFMPIARPKVKAKQLLFDTEWTRDRLKESDEVNRFRTRVAAWRQGGYLNATPTTRALLSYWTDPERERKLFFCQIEALETTIYITEAARKSGDTWIDGFLTEANNRSNPGLPRLALKMATGSGKTVVMAMLIAWQALNKLAYRSDRRFSDTFLIITPGITIRDRLRVLLPSDPNNYYRVMDVVPADMRETLNAANIQITNFHAFKPREWGDAAKLTKDILRAGESENPFAETPDQMVERVCRTLGKKRDIIVINDEAHHCYRHRPDDDEPRLTGDDRKEAQKRDEEARIWISGVEAIGRKRGVKRIFDLSATPFFLSGSGYSEGTLFPWVVSDFSLIDAIESGIVKVPRVPVSDDALTSEMPTYRDLWQHIRDDLPKKGKRGANLQGEPRLPIALEGALHTLYDNYEKRYRQWQEARANGSAQATPPVFIVVCNNTAVSKLVYDYIAGWNKDLDDGTNVPVPGRLSLFSNVEDRRWSARPNTILIDSEQLESGENMSADFKALAATEIAEFKAEYRQRFPGRDVEDLTDEDLLREVMNTVGKAGKLGEGVRCVVSVSMLTEGWDANTVTHILGVRAFGTQLLCEQVVGRGLRRISYAPDEHGMLPAEYAEVYGVPFSFIPSNGAVGNPKPAQPATRVRALQERIAAEVTFPRVVGYRYEIEPGPLPVHFSEDSRISLSARDVPLQVDVAPIVGQAEVHSLDDLQQIRIQTIAFQLADLVLRRYFAERGADQHWLYPQILRITREWLAECVTVKDHAFSQMLWLSELRDRAVDKIYGSIVDGSSGTRTLKPILRPYDTVGSTRYVDFDTRKATYQTEPAKCHVSHVAMDSGWEAKMAAALEGMPEVRSYVKNQGLGFTIPYVWEGEQRQYIPDFIVRIDDRLGEHDLLNLIVEVTGERKQDKEAKAATARTFWVPAINNHGQYGRWAYIESTDPWDAEHLIRGHASGEGGDKRWSA
jgi:type III restriction enzyme